MKTEPDVVIDTEYSYEKMLRFVLFNDYIHLLCDGEETVIQIDVSPTERMDVFDEEIDELLDEYKRQVLETTDDEEP
jgi:hypothetical protein